MVYPSDVSFEVIMFVRVRITKNTGPWRHGDNPEASGLSL